MLNRKLPPPYTLAQLLACGLVRNVLKLAAKGGK